MTIKFTDGEGNEWTLQAEQSEEGRGGCLIRSATLDDIARAGLAQPDTYLEAIGEAIDHDLGWNTPEDEERGEYTERIRQVARELKALRALETRLRAAPARMPYPLRDDVLALLEAIDEARK